MKTLSKLTLTLFISILILNSKLAQGQFSLVGVETIGTSPGHSITSFTLNLEVLELSAVGNDNYTIELQRGIGSSWTTIQTKSRGDIVAISPSVPSAITYQFQDSNPSTGANPGAGDNGINTYRFRSTWNSVTIVWHTFTTSSYDYSNEIDCAKYNDVYRKAGHNSYEISEFLTLKEALGTTQSIEIDFHGSGTNGRWEVRHANLFDGNHNNCGTGDDHFDICLDDVIEWSNNNPNHEVITLFLDAKSGWNSSTGRSTSDFDNLLSSTFGNKLFTPSDLKGTFLTVRAAAQANNWPLMNDLKGKIICVLTGASEDIGYTPGNPKLNQYVSERGNNAKAFIAPGVTQSSEINSIPDFNNTNNLKWVVFYNMDMGEIDYEPSIIFDNNFITRVYEVGATGGYAETSNSDYIWDISKKTQFIAIHKTGQTEFNNGKMDGSYGATNDLSISGEDLVCNNQYSNFTLSSSTLSGSYNWSVSNSNLSIASGQTSSTATVKGKSSGGGDVVLTTTLSNGGCSYSRTKNIFVGKPDYTKLDFFATNSGGPHEIMACDYTTADAEYDGGSGHSVEIDEYEWDIPYSYAWDIYEDYGGTIDMRYVEIEYYENPAPSTETIKLRAHNTCGWSSWKSITADVDDNCGGYYYSMAPNPSSEELSISFIKSNESTSPEKSSDAGALSMQANIPVQVEIYNSAQTRVLSGKGNVSDGDIKINTSTLKPGSYFVHVLLNGQVDKNIC